MDAFPRAVEPSILFSPFSFLFHNLFFTIITDAFQVAGKGQGGWLPGINNSISGEKKKGKLL